MPAGLVLNGCSTDVKPGSFNTLYFSASAGKILSISPGLQSTLGSIDAPHPAAQGSNLNASKIDLDEFLSA